MKFRYLGEAPNGSIVQHGVEFSAGGISEVTEEAAIAVLKGNRFFEAVPDSLDEVVSDDIEHVKRKPGRPRKVEPDANE